MEKELMVQVGIGTFHIYEGDPAYGSVNIDLVVEKNGKKVSLPVAVVENPVDPGVASSVTDVNATTVYVYGDMDEDEYTHKIVIPNSVAEDAIAEYCSY